MSDPRETSSRYEAPGKAAGYAGRSKKRNRDEARLLATLVDGIALGRTLDAPCGAARLAPFFELRNAQWVGLDLAAAMLDRARAAGRHPLVRARLQRLPFADESFDLKPIARDAVPEAIRKAEHYRLLNDPEQAESICLDILETDPDNERALIVLILALTDQFGQHGGAPGQRTARECVAKLKDEYQRHYYSGLIHERHGRALLRGGVTAGFAYEPFREAMECYARAEAIRLAGNDDAILRWNSCARTMRREHLQPRVDEGELPLE